MARLSLALFALFAAIASVVVARELTSACAREEGRRAEGSGRRAVPTPPHPLPHPPGTADCVALAQQIGRGECASFLNDVKGDINGLAPQSDDGFRAGLAPYIARHGSGGQLNGGCCGQSASFIAQGCSCNRLILSAATRLGFSGSVVSSIPRLYQFSCVGGAASFPNGCSFSGYGASG